MPAATGWKPPQDAVVSETEGWTPPDDAIVEPSKKKVPTTTDSSSGSEPSQFQWAGGAVAEPQIKTENERIESQRTPTVNFASNAIDRGINQGALADLLNVNNGELTDEVIAEIARLQKENQQLPVSPEFRQFSEIKDIDNQFSFLAKNPSVLGEVLLTSLSSQVRHGLTRAGAGAGIGALMGGVPGAAMGAIAGMGVASLNQEYSGKIMDTFTEMGVDVTDPKQLKEAFTDEKKFSEAKELGLKRGIPVAVFDILSGGLGGKIITKPATSALGKLGQGAAELAIQGTAGAAGELAGQASAGEEINTGEALLEFGGEFSSAPMDITLGAIANKSSKGESVRSDIAKAVASLPPTPEAAQTIGQQVDVLKATGEITSEQADDIIQNTANAIAANATIPEQVQGEARIESLPLLMEKKDLEAGIAELEAQKESTDPTFHSVIDEQIKQIQGQVDEVVKKIGEVITPNLNKESVIKVSTPESLISDELGTDRIYKIGDNTGYLTVDGQTIVLETPDKIIEVGNVNEISSKPLSEFGITIQEEIPVTINNDNSVNVRGETYINNFSKPESAISKDKDGNYSVSLETSDGKKRTFRGAAAENIAYQITLKNFENATDEQIAKAEQLADESIQTKGEVEQVTAKEKVADIGTTQPTETVAGETTEKSPVQVKSSLPLQKDKANEEQDIIQKGEYKESGVDRKTEGDTEENVQRGLSIATTWLSNDTGSSSKESRDEAEKFFGEQAIGEKRGEFILLGGNDGGREEIRASLLDGEKVGKEIAAVGTRSPYQRGLERQSDRESEIIDPLGTLKTTQPTNLGDGEGQVFKLSETERGAVVDAVSKLSTVQNDKEKAFSAGILRGMLSQNIQSKEKITEILSLIKNNFNPQTNEKNTSKGESITEESSSGEKDNVQATEEKVTTSSQAKPVSEEGKKRRKKALLNRAFDGSDETLKPFIEKHGLNYDIEHWSDAKKSADSFVNEVGDDAALQAVRGDKIDDGAAAFIWAKLIDNVYAKIKTETDPKKLNELRAHVSVLVDQFDKKSRSGGRFISALQEVYRASDFKYRFENVINTLTKEAGETPSRQMQEKISKLTSDLEVINEKLKAHEQKVKELEEKIAFEKIQADIAFEKGKKESVKDKGKKLADQFRKLKTKPIVLKDENGNPINFETLGFTLNDAIEAIAKLIEKTSNVAQAINDYLSDAAWYKKLTDAGKAAVQSQLLDHFSKEATPPASVSVDEDGKLIIPPALIRSIVESGIDNIDDLTKAVHKLFEEEYTDITERMVRDAITEYGKQRFPSEDEIRRKVSELKRDGKLLSGLEDAVAGKAPLRSGYQRPKPTDSQREMQRKIKDAMKNLPEDAAEVERKWATAQDRIKTMLENRIADLEKQIAEGKREPRNNKRTVKNEENEALQKRVDELKEQLDIITGEKELTYEQRVNHAMNAAERTLKDLTEQIEKGDLAYKAKQVLAPTPELVALRNKVKDARNTLNEMRKEAGVAEQRRIDLYKNKLKKDIAELQSRLDEKRFDKKKRKEPVELDEAGMELEAERMRLKEEVDIEIEKERLKNRGKLERAGDFAADVLNIPRSLMASMDVSSLLRQGIVLGARHPIMASKALAKAVGFAFSEKKYNDYMRKLKTTPDYVRMKKAGLYLSEPSSQLSAKEEQFMSNLAHKIPLIGSLIKGSERAYTGQLNKLRVDVFNDFYNKLKDDGVTGKLLDENMKSMSAFINQASGRGNLGKWGNQSAPLLNAAFFAPRYVASRINILGRILTAGGVNMPKETRIEVLKTLGSYIGLGMSILALANLAGADSDDDPTSSDFGKIKVGNIRLDVWAGFQQLVVLLARLGLNRTTNASTGEQIPLNTGAYNSKTSLDVLGEFAANKFAPSLNIGMELATRHNRNDKSFFWKEIDKKYEPISAEGMILGNIAPIWQQDIWEIAEKQGGADAALAGASSFLGLGVQYYEPRYTDEIQNEAYDMVLKKGKPLSDKEMSELKKSFEENEDYYEDTANDRIIKGETLALIKDKPEYYRDVYYAGNNENKTKIITSLDLDDNEIHDLYMAGVISGSLGKELISK